MCSIAWVIAYIFYHFVAIKRCKRYQYATTLHRAAIVVSIHSIRAIETACAVRWYRALLDFLAVASFFGLGAESS